MSHHKSMVNIVVYLIVVTTGALLWKLIKWCITKTEKRINN